MMKFCSNCGTSLILGDNWTEARKKHHMNSCNKCNSNKNREWRNKNPGKARISAKYSKMKSNYGLTKDQYLNLYSETNGCCFICGEHESLFKRGLHVDHCHTTGMIRGLLCSNCNTALGKFKEDSIILEKAIQYLNRTKDED